MNDTRQRDPNRPHGDSKAYRVRKKAELASFRELLATAKLVLPSIGNTDMYIDLHRAISRAEGKAT